MNKILNVNFKTIKSNPTMDSESSIYEIPFYKDNDYFSNFDNFIGFVKETEKMVRTSTFYNKYISYIKDDIGLKCCQVLPNIEDDYADIEMHHGPILTLFDYISILIDYLLINNKKINSFIVSNIIIDEHYDNNIQIVMLSKTVHQQVHANNIFINLHQAFGDLNTFLKKYNQGLHEDQINKINQYIELSKKYNSFDKNVLELNKNIKKWSK
jgi:hypothetical protein